METYTVAFFRFIDGYMVRETEYITLKGDSKDQHRKAAQEVVDKYNEPVTVIRVSIPVEDSQ